VSRLHVWVDDFATEALPDLVDGLARSDVMVMRSFARVPNPAMVAQLSPHRQVAMIGGRDFNQLVSRIELATTTLKVGVIAVLPKGVEGVAALRGPGVIDVLPANLQQSARRVMLMSSVPIVSGTRSDPKALRPGGAPGPLRVGRGEHRALAIASSTGGCWVLAELLKALPQAGFPVLLAQHLDGEFVGFFAQWLTASTPWRTHVVEEPIALEPGVVYLPAGGKDLCVDREEHAFSAASVSRFVPNADRLLGSCADVFGARVTGIVLSGMGSDGAQGLAAVARHGGRAFCQAPSTAIVPSMPESALRLTRGATALSPELLGTAVLQVFQD
jgi:two-component system chemotaxis response regulator CheB